MLKASGDKVLPISCENARVIFDNICLRIDGKKASAWTSQATPFSDLETIEDWGQEANNAKNETSRTDAFLFGYTLFTGGKIPMRGIQFNNGYVRPDAWVVGALLKSDRISVDPSAKMFELTELGWERLLALSTEFERIN
ncbi:hypothetical protein E0H72_21835 [Rhizobium leguminosarum bv. viciae]|uniref:hypothetical protein n=1 Tax=Rhizobium leguminosarum TaxID=384 RepID=UPI001038F904|nr:hypothetical protein [Rhizobium leguminosarum]TCA40092.1 hypothetical protein E0H72_21835 [Rhizobium leguminosarum bv. viciae]